MPAYEARRATVTSARLSADDARADTGLLEDVDALAIDALEKQSPTILARAVARAVIKTKASKQADSRSDALGFVVNLAGAITDRADTRSWSTLPNKVYIARLPLPQGHHQVEVELLDRSGGVVKTKHYEVDIGDRAKRFLSLHWIMASDLDAINPLRAQ
jgi:hypothetical protein